MQNDNFASGSQVPLRSAGNLREGSDGKFSTFFSNDAAKDRCFVGTFVLSGQLWSCAR
jgi:hypothetical protein